jgi:CRISPR-associated protein Cas1
MPAALDPDARLKVVQRMFQIRFGEAAPLRRSVEQLRGVEGARVRTIYQGLARQFGIEWTRRDYDPAEWSHGDVPNRCLSAATACLYGITEAAVIAAGYAPAVGFLHTGKPLSFVYDIADLYKFETVVPEAFRIAGRHAKGKLGGADPVRETRIACRDAFRRTNILARLIPGIEDILAAGGLDRPARAPDAVLPAFNDPEPSGEEGHRG